MSSTGEASGAKSTTKDQITMLEEYRNHLLAAGKSEGTVKMRLGHIERFARECGDIMFLARRRKTHSAEARKSMRSSFRSFYGWTRRTGRRLDDPAADLPPIRIPRTIPRVAQDPEVEMALVGASLQETAMILLGRYAGLRLSEITTLHTDHREYDLLRVTGKGEKQRLVPIHPDLYVVLLDLEDELDGGWYFPGRFGGHLHPASVNKIITRRLGANPHSLRHAAGTSANRGTGGDIRAVQEFLGHASIATTQRYVHIDMDNVREAANATTLKSRRHLRAVPVAPPPKHLPAAAA
jgi:site-specific recombinase XerD